MYENENIVIGINQFKFYLKNAEKVYKTKLRGILDRRYDHKDIKKVRWSYKEFRWNLGNKNSELNKLVRNKTIV